MHHSCQPSYAKDCKFSSKSRSQAEIKFQNSNQIKYEETIFTHDYSGSAIVLKVGWP